MTVNAPSQKQRDLVEQGWFDFHPANPATGPMHDAVRADFKRLAKKLQKNLPAGPDRTVAIRALQVAMMQANACIANAGIEPEAEALNPHSTDKLSSQE